jgi:hypothetical protein
MMDIRSHNEDDGDMAPPVSTLVSTDRHFFATLFVKKRGSLSPPRLALRSMHGPFSGFVWV